MIKPFFTSLPSVAGTIIRLGLVLVFAWFVLLGVYIDDVFNHPFDKTTKADAIIVLTGGTGRIPYGVSLLKNNHAPLLFISGVDSTVNKGDVFDPQTLPAKTLQCCVEIEKQAKNTAGNIRAIREWATKRNVSSVILVTSDYHMPRVLDYLKKTDTPKTVFTASVPYVTREMMMSGIRPWFVILNEFHKYLYQRLTGITEI